MNYYKQQKQKADMYNSIIERIVQVNAAKFINFSVANLKLDCEESTDFIVSADTRIAARVRNISAYQYKDITIRTKVQSGNKTEIDKLREGFGDWYIYVWIPKGNTSKAEYVLVDLNEVRTAGLLNNLITKDNNNFKDNTGFGHISLKDLYVNGCIKNQYLQTKTIEELKKEGLKNGFYV